MRRVSSRSAQCARRQNVELPLKGYFLGVGSALLIGLLAAHWLLPAPAPNPLISSRVRLPPIRIYSPTKAPEEVPADHDPIAVSDARTESDAPEADRPTSSTSPPDAMSERRSAPASSRTTIMAPGHSASRVRNSKAREALAQFIAGESEPARTTPFRHRQIPKKG